MPQQSVPSSSEGQYQPSNWYAYPAVVSYDPSTFALAGVIYFNLSTNPTSLARWGADGFCFPHRSWYNRELYEPDH
jgi:hypothetical protein